MKKLLKIGGVLLCAFVVIATASSLYGAAGGLGAFLVCAGVVVWLISRENKG